MTRVYDFDYRRYFSPSHTIANEIRHSGNGLGNEYFRSTNYAVSYDRGNEIEKQFNSTTTPKEGEGIVDSILNVGKTAINLAKDNKELISAVGSIAGAVSQISKANESAQQLAAMKRIKSIRDANLSASNNNSNNNSKVANPETIQRIRDNFTGRGMGNKKGGILKSF